MNKRIIAAMPLISVMLFLFFGLYKNNWSLGATFFFLIPMSWILLSRNPLRRLSDMMPMIALAVFLWIGFGFKVWHPTCLVFFFSSRRRHTILVSDWSSDVCSSDLSTRFFSSRRRLTRLVSDGVQTCA